jgi:hypothetical protein
MTSSTDVYILCNDAGGEVSTALEAMLSSPGARGFNVHHQEGAFVPDGDWYESTGNMSKSESDELYNHALLWHKIMESGTSGIILYNRAIPVQPNAVMVDLMTKSCNLGPLVHEDIILYGKYMDTCKRHVKVFDVETNGFKFPLYRTTNAGGAFAYQVTPTGAKKLLTGLGIVRLPVHEYIRHWIRNEIIHAVTFHPNLFHLGASVNDTAEPVAFHQCSDELDTDFEWSIGKIIIALIATIVGAWLFGVFIWFMYKNITHPTPNDLDATKKMVASRAPQAPPTELPGNKYGISSMTPVPGDFSRV